MPRSCTAYKFRGRPDSEAQWLERRIDRPSFKDRAYRVAALESAARTMAQITQQKLSHALRESGSKPGLSFCWSPFFFCRFPPDRKFPPRRKSQSDSQLPPPPSCHPPLPIKKDSTQNTAWRRNIF